LPAATSCTGPIRRCAANTITATRSKYRRSRHIGVTASPRCHGSRPRRLISERIWACTETSSAVVGSSAMIKSCSARLPARSRRAGACRRRIVWIGSMRLSGRGNAGLRQQVDGALAARSFREVQGVPNGLNQLVAAPIQRIEAGEGVLQIMPIRFPRIALLFGGRLSIRMPGDKSQPPAMRTGRSSGRSRRGR